MCMPGALSGQKRKLYPMELETQREGYKPLS